MIENAWWATVVQSVVEKGHSEEVTFKVRQERAIEMQVENSQCKDLETGMSLSCLYVRRK